jgi:hypothetical protein
VPLDMRVDKGVPIDRQVFTWREMIGPPYSKLDDDAFTRVRVLLMRAIEGEALRFSHACARTNRELSAELARIRRIEQHQQTLVGWLNPPDQSALETSIALEQTAIEVTASVAQSEPDRALAAVYRAGLVEDVDHLYRFSALMDRVEGKDANAILQSYTDLRPGRPTSAAHRHLEEELGQPYRRDQAAPITRLGALTLLACQQAAQDYYMAVGPSFADPVARGLYAEIASAKEQHVTRYESLIDPDETWLEKWLLHEACEVYHYWCCVETEPNRHLQGIWDRFLGYELGQLHAVMELMKKIERRDPAEVLPDALPVPMRLGSQREFVRAALRDQPAGRDGAASTAVREQLNAGGAPSDIVAEGYRWRPGTELPARAGVDLEGRLL